MKNTKKLFLSALALLSLSAFATSQEAEDFSSLEDFSDFSDFGTSSQDTGSALEVNGKLSTEVRAYLDKDEEQDFDVKVNPSGSLTFKYNGSKSDASLTLSANPDKIKEDPTSLIDELVLRGYFGNLTLEAGKMKIVWGKGDKLHVLDNFNADDYSDFIIPDYIDRRIATPMLRASYSFPAANLNLEAVYTPLLPTDRFASEGRWTPAQLEQITSSVTGSAEGNVAASFIRYTTDTATAGTLNALYAEYMANEAAYNTALGSAAKQYVESTAGEGSWDAMSKEMQDGVILQNKAALETGIREKGYGYLIDNYSVSKGAYQAACQESGFDVDSIETELLLAGTSYMLGLENAALLKADSSVIYPNMKSLKYGQFGTRLTCTLGQVDLGASYYNGYFKQPSVNASKIDSFVASYLEDGSVSEEEKFLAYDSKQTFGLEAATVIWHFNLRGEVAYNLTKDTAGTDPWVHNNSVAWLGGFDIDLPFWNANLNVQEYGSFILHGKECDKESLDVDYCSKGYSNNKLVANFTCSFLNDKLAPELTALYGFERGDLAILPGLCWRPDQNLSLKATGMYIHCKDSDSEFAPWQHNSFASLSASYQF